MLNNACLLCKQPIPVRRGDRRDKKYCGHKCAQKARKTVKVRNCERCRNKFKPPNNKQRFCSLECKRAAAKKVREAVCIVCSKPFQQKAAQQKCCSKACAIRRCERIKKEHRPPPNITNCVDTLNYAPDDANRIDRWLVSLPEEQFKRVWLAVIVEQFGEGQRAALSRALLVVRQRLQGGGQVVPEQVAGGAPVVGVEEPGEFGEEPIEFYGPGEFEDGHDELEDVADLNARGFQVARADRVRRSEAVA